MTQYSPKRPVMFGELPQSESRFGSFATSMGINAAIIILLLLVSMVPVYRIKSQPMNTVALTFQRPEVKPYIPPVLRRTHIPPPPAIKQPVMHLNLQQLRPTLKPKPVQAPKTETLKAPAVPMPKWQMQKMKVKLAPQVKVGMFKSTSSQQKPVLPVVSAVKTGSFAQSAGSIRNARRVQEVAEVGAFNSSETSTTGVAHRGVVQSGHFGGDGVVSQDHGPSGRVVSAGFSSSFTSKARLAVHKKQEAALTPLVILSKPLPDYTPEAKRMKIQGYVTLKVRFTASGEVQVLDVISGLGHGLDHQAVIAAEHIQFTPEKRNGHPINDVTIIRVLFQLA